MIQFFSNIASSPNFLLGSLGVTTCMLATCITLYYRRFSSIRKSEYAQLSSQQACIQVLEEKNFELQKQTELQELLLNAISTAVWIRDIDGTLTYCNQSFQHMLSELGGSKEPTNILPWFILEEGLQCAYQKHIVINAERRSFSITEQISAHDSKFILGSALDITQIKQSEQDLSRHVAAQSDLLEASASAAAIFGVDKKLSFYNQAFIKLWGLDEHTLKASLGYGDLLEMLREKRKLPEQVDFQAFKREQLSLFTSLTETHNAFFHLPNGTTLRVIIIPHALGGLLFSYEDITDKLTLERQYNTLIAVQRATLDHLQEGGIVFGEDGRVTLYNARYQNLWKLEKAFLDTRPHISELLEQTKSLHTYENSWEETKAMLTNLVFGRKHITFRKDRTDGKVVECVIVPLPDGATLITCLDVTDSTLLERSLRERNQALEQVDKIKTEFLANVSYELRTPLNSIIGFAELLGQQHFGPLNKKQEEYVSAVVRSSQQLLKLINNLLDITSIEAGFLYLDIDQVTIEKLFDQLTHLYQHQLAEKSLQIHRVCEKDIGHILGDKVRLVQALGHLIDNAYRHAKIDSTITLGARTSEEMIELWVEDQGNGIPEKELQYLFKDFRKVSSLEDIQSGAGLGLSLVRRLIELHGGSVRIESSVGRGTKVTCLLKRENALILQYEYPGICV